MGGRDSWGAWDGLVHTAMFKTDRQQGPAVRHRELCPRREAAWLGAEFAENGYVCMCATESLGCPPETGMTLSVSDSPV